MSDVRTKLLTHHRGECSALQAVDDGYWPTPWAYLERIEYRIGNGNKASQRQSGDRWWYVRCNDPRCPAEIAINETDLLGLVSS